MINLTELENRRTEHTERVARVNRDGWIKDLSRWTKRDPEGSGSPMVRILGELLLRTGHRLKETGNYRITNRAMR